MGEEQPKLLTNCTLLYNRLDSEAITLEVPTPSSGSRLPLLPDRKMRVWRGRLVATCDELGIPRGSYTRVVNALRVMGCIEQLSRGFRGTALSEYALLTPPTLDRFEENLAREPLTGPPSTDTLRVELADLQRQLGGIDLPDALLNIERRLSAVEHQLKQLTKER